MMTLGGNKNLYEYFKTYDLNEESVQMRYKTKAAEFYRSQVSYITTNFPISYNINTMNDINIDIVVKMLS